MTFMNKAILIAVQAVSISSAAYANELSQGNDVAAYQAPNQLSDTVSSAPKSVSTKPVLPRYLDYVDIEPATNNPLYDEFLESPNSTEKFKQPVLNKQTSAITAAPTMTVRSAYTPVCPTLNINTAYNLPGTVAGSSYCYHFNIAQKAKTQAFVIQQNAATNMTLVVLRHEANGSFTNLGVSNNPSNQDEKLLILTEPGNYYWYLTANASNGGAFAFGAAVNTAIDDYELNDTPATATVMPDKWNKIFANMDSAQDIDYYRFNAVRGQKVVIGLMDRYGLNEWLLEVFNGSGWRQLALNPHHKVDNLSAGQDVFVRVRPNPNVPLNTNHNYELIFGSRIAGIDQIDVGTTENLVRLRHGTTNPYLSTQVHNILNWSVRISDSTGKVLPGVTVKFHVHMFLGSWAKPAIFDAKVTGVDGKASGQLTPPECRGEERPVEHTDLNNNRWLTLYNRGEWSIEVPEAIYSDYVGVGGSNVTGVTLAHICDQTLLRASR